LAGVEDGLLREDSIVLCVVNVVDKELLGTGIVVVGNVISGLKKAVCEDEGPKYGYF